MQVFPLLSKDGSPSGMFGREGSAAVSVSPTHATHARNSVGLHILQYLRRREEVPFPYRNVYASGTFVDPFNFSQSLGHKSWVKEAFLSVVQKEPGVLVQDRVTKGAVTSLRTDILFVDCTAPTAMSRSRTNASGWGIPVMSYAQFFCTFYYLPSSAVPAAIAFTEEEDSATVAESTQSTLPE